EVLGHDGAVVSFVIPHPTLTRLRNLSRDHRVSLFMTLLTGFQTLLFRLSGREDIVIGTPLSIRNRPETERLIGFFVNILPLRLNFSGDFIVRDMLNQARSVTLEAFAHQDLPFEQLVEKLKIQRSLSYHPVFQITFGLHNAPRVPWQ